MVEEVRQKLAGIESACREHLVDQLWLFGSATGNGSRAFDPQSSDIDLVVTFQRSPDHLLADQFLGLAENLQQLLNRRVQLMTDRSIRNPYLREEIDETKELLYAASRENALV